MNNPIFSIITVTLNNLSGLKDIYENLTNQKFSDYEWVVVDGGSSDGSFEYLSSISNSKVQWVSETDNGIYHAMNKGLLMAKGEYMNFMNAGDNFCSENTLKLVYKEIKKIGSPDLIYGHSFNREANGVLHLKPCRYSFFVNYGMPASHQSMFYKSSIFERYKYDESLKIASDYKLTSAVIKDSEYSISKVNFPICIFNLNGLSNYNSDLAVLEQKMIWRDIFNHPVFLIYLFRFSQVMALFLRTKVSVVYYLLRKLV